MCIFVPCSCGKTSFCYLPLVGDSVLTVILLVLGDGVWGELVSCDVEGTFCGELPNCEGLFVMGDGLASVGILALKAAERQVVYGLLSLLLVLLNVL